MREGLLRFLFRGVTPERQEPNSYTKLLEVSSILETWAEHLAKVVFLIPLFNVLLEIMTLEIDPTQSSMAYSSSIQYMHATFLSLVMIHCWMILVKYTSLLFPSANRSCTFPSHSPPIPLPSPNSLLCYTIPSCRTLSILHFAS